MSAEYSFSGSAGGEPVIAATGQGNYAFSGLASGSVSLGDVAARAVSHASAVVTAPPIKRDKGVSREQTIWVMTTTSFAAGFGSLIHGKMGSAIGGIIGFVWAFRHWAD